MDKEIIRIMDKKDIYEAKEELAVEYGKSVILKDIENFDKINDLIEYRKKANINLGKDIIAAGKKVTNALLAAAEAYCKEEEKGKETMNIINISDIVFRKVLKHENNSTTEINFNEVKEGDIISFPDDITVVTLRGRYYVRSNPYLSLDLPEGTKELKIEYIIPIE